MMTRITVLEYACLTTAQVPPTLELAQIPDSAFAYLCRLSERFSATGARLLQLAGRQSLRLDNYVGVINTPCGTVIEVLPKLYAGNGSVASCRMLLRKMILRTLGIRGRDVGPALLQQFEVPLDEWVMRRFLDELQLLVRRGIRFDYHRIEETQPFLRGQLNILAQLRQPPGRDHRFNVRHDVFSPDRPENRLLKLAVEKVRAKTGQADSWRLASELSIRMSEVDPSSLMQEDFRSWNNDRLMARYQTIKPWCELMLLEDMPFSLAGERLGNGMLFPMEKLFEKYLVDWLSQNAATNVDIRHQACSRHLCRHDDKDMFVLKPDVLISKGRKTWVVDAKWKLLDGDDRMRKYGISEADMYQMFAYGHKYLDGAGEMLLIYPRSERFSRKLDPFVLGGGLSLHALPFDLELDRLVGAERCGCDFLKGHPQNVHEGDRSGLASESRHQHI